MNLSTGTPGKAPSRLSACLTRLYAARLGLRAAERHGAPLDAQNFAEAIAHERRTLARIAGAGRHLDLAEATCSHLLGVPLDVLLGGRIP